MTTSGELDFVEVQLTLTGWTEYNPQ